ANGIANIFGEAFRIEFEKQGEFRTRRRSRSEGDPPELTRATCRRPTDQLIGTLFHDLSVELPLNTGNLDLPLSRPVVDLDHALDVVHEVRVRLELRPLVVHRSARLIDEDGVLLGSHAWPFAWWWIRLVVDHHWRSITSRYPRC